MTEEEEIALVKRLPKGSRRAILAMSFIPTLPGRATFNANAAHNLRWTARKHGGLAEYVITGKRAAYYLTPLGMRIRDRLLASADTHPKDGDAKQAPLVSGAVPEGQTPKGSGQ